MKLDTFIKHSACKARDISHLASSRARLLAVAATAIFAALNAHASPGQTAPVQVSAVEYYYTPLDYYFLTSRDADKSLLDGVTGWQRTGKIINGVSAPVSGTSGLARYYFDKVARSATRGSHFFTVLDSERASLAALNPSNGLVAALPYYEGMDSFVNLPTVEGVGGSCPGGQQAVYRLFRDNARFPDDPNHRFTTDLATYQDFVSRGWLGEGVKFCSPAALANTADCPQKAYFPDVSQSTHYIDKNLDGATVWDANALLRPAVAVSCAGGVVSVASSGIPNFDSVAIGRNGADANYQLNNRTWRFPQAPSLSATTTELRNVLDAIAVMVNGVQIYGPVEAPQDNFADPLKAGLLNFCGGHVAQYHFHSFPECFFNQKTLAGNTTFLPAKTPNVVIGYAFDGFPILAPYESCNTAGDATCVNGIREIRSAYRYTGTGAYTTEAAFDSNVYEAGFGGSTLDRCNGRVNADGSYAYYATRQFPYYLACYRGTRIFQ